MAEEQGFEPWSQVSPANRLAGGRTRPLCDSSTYSLVAASRRSLSRVATVAEGEGFEPPGLSTQLFSRQPP